MAFNIFNPSIQTILSLFEESTARPYYAAELQGKGELSKPTVLNIVNQLQERGILHREEEQVTEYTNRGARSYYTLTPYGLHLCRLMPPST